MTTLKRAAPNLIWVRRTGSDGSSVVNLSA